ncbi:MATE family efflux transporter [Clostridium tagluense]|uniref:MATE family efflux transporter n=1 Tax=Clostridium tagluense TaxID=360422 RepID=UPI001CF19FA9|nr:MATE family efflux transporter [Clostridium tagluense]MCB2310180.1 MATE family efflux transporter [Clostridium tagluense]MCB2315178.1 MATE family efflux transporter [Clostridium tagluense]MCB2319880.1 MATE family efflux transporter [Clostridium tagluense]MCB2324921.1 MATE family efflux transporter [Clostridium tagluense]MCB2329625.1 MATE family efflux transporter [Clostridium tagluense]
MLNVLVVKIKIMIFKMKNPRSKEVFNIAWPVLTELLLGTLFGMIDMIMLGRIKDTAIAAASVAAVGITNQPLFIGLSLIQALNIGGTAIVARYIGSKRLDKVENTIKHIILLSQVFFALPLSIIGLVFTKEIMAFIGAQSDTLLVGVNYFRAIMLGFIFQSFNFSLSAVLRGAGDTKTPMKINLKANFINVFGNAVLIYGLIGFPALGVTGAGISTAVSNMIATVLLCTKLLSGKCIIKFNIKSHFKFDKNIMYNLIKIGIPASLEQMAMRVGIMIFIKVVAGLGTLTFAAHQICLSILGLSFTPGQAFGISAASLIGRSLGEGKPGKADEYGKEARRIGSIISSIMAIILFVFGPQLVGLYTKDPEIIKMSSTALKIIAFVQPFQSSQLILAGALRGAGDTIWPLVSTFIGVIGIRTILAYIFVSKLGLGLSGAWIAVFVDQFIRWVLIYSRYRTGKWKYIKLR